MLAFSSWKTKSSLNTFGGSAVDVTSHMQSLRAQKVTFIYVSELMCTNWLKSVLVSVVGTLYEETSNLLLFKQAPDVAWHVGSPWGFKCFYFTWFYSRDKMCLEAQSCTFKSVSIPSAGPCKSAAECATSSMIYSTLSSFYHCCLLSLYNLKFFFETFPHGSYSIVQTRCESSSDEVERSSRRCRDH